MTVKIDKRRYLLVRFLGKKPKREEFDKEIRKIVRYFYGELTLIWSNLHIVDEWNNFFFIRTNHRYVDQIEAAITIMWSEDFIADIICKSGTIKGLKRRFKNLFETASVSS